MKRFWVLLAALLVMGMCACQSGKQAGGTSGLSASGDIKLDGNPVTVAGVTFQPPSTWKDVGASGMRQANYTFGPVSGEADSATMAVFYFGQTGGGGIKENIERWITQMSLPGGGDPHSASSQHELTVDGMPVHWVEVAGTYSASMGGMMGGQTVEKTDYVMTAAVVEAAQGNLFFKMTGPKGTALEMAKGFKTMILALKKSA